MKMSYMAITLIGLLMFNSPGYADKAAETSSPKRTVIAGTVGRISEIPNPERNDYDNCLYCVELLTHRTADGSATDKIILVLPILKNRVLLKDNILTLAENIEVSVSRYDEMPEAIRQIQISDSFEDWETDYYFVHSIRKITLEELNAVQTEIIGSYARTIRLPEPLHCSEADENARMERTRRIKNELIKVEAKRQRHGQNFDVWKKEYKAYLDRLAQIQEKSCWIDGSYFASPQPFQIRSDKLQSFIAEILPYKKYLEEHNIDLILVRIPAKGELSATVLLSTEEYLENPYWLELYQACLQNDIEVLDPLPQMWKRHAEFPLHYFYHIPEEGHPCVGASWIIGEEIGRLLKRYKISETTNLIRREGTYTGPGKKNRNCYPAGNPMYPAGERIRFTTVLNQDTERPFPASVAIASPFLFISNSFGIYPDLKQGASIPHYSALQTNVIPAWSYQDGIGISMLRNCVMNPASLNERKLVILLMHPNMWFHHLPPLPLVVLQKFSTLTLEKKSWGRS